VLVWSVHDLLCYLGKCFNYSISNLNSFFFYRIAIANRENLKQASLNKNQGGFWGMLKNVGSSSGSTESILIISINT
jgi:hypothetical protein